MAFLDNSGLAYFWNKIKSKLSAVAFSGSYSDLTGKPSIPDTSDFVNISGSQTITGKKVFSTSIGVNKAVDLTLNLNNKNMLGAIYLANDNDTAIAFMVNTDKGNDSDSIITYIDKSGIIPRATDSLSLGRSDRKWHEAYINNLHGNADTASSLKTSRTLKIGSKGYSFDGSGNISWTLAEIGAASASHTHSVSDVTGLQTALDGKASSSHTHSGYVTLSGAQTITGTKTFSTLGWGGGTTYNLNSSGGINSANINANGFVRPSASNTYTCGQSTRKWSNCYATTFNGSLADYAEYFEWSDGNPENQDRRGLFVTISDGEKISIAGENDDILGIVSAAPLLVGDCITDEWSGKYKKDIFGAYLPDENGDKIISENYDENQEYISREDRSEWSAVGLLGKLVMPDDGSCVVGGYCKPCSDGSGRASHSIEITRCKVMKRLDETHIKVFFH